MLEQSKLYCELNTAESPVIGVSASGKQGKSALGFALSHYVPGLCDRGKYILEADLSVDLSMFPGYNIVGDLDDVPPDSVVHIEDLASIFNSRGSGNDNFLPSYLGSVSHKRIALIFTVQSLSAADISFFKLQNYVDLHKWMYEEDIPFEREEFILTQTLANHYLQKVSEDNPLVPAKSLVYSSRYHEVTSWPLPPWWSDRCAYYLRDVKIRNRKKGGKSGN